jgi:hypothetical protein
VIDELLDVLKNPPHQSLGGLWIIQSDIIRNLIKVG